MSENLVKEKVFEKAFKRDGLLKFIKDEIEFIGDEGKSWGKEYSNKDEAINTYKSFIEIIEKEDEPSAKYKIEIFKEKNGDMNTYLATIKKV